MGKLHILFAALLLLSMPFAFQLQLTRDQLLDRYYSQVSDKIPKSARILLGDETINVYIGSSVVGVRTKNGELAELETHALPKPTVVITVDDSTAARIENREIGILSALDSGGIKVKANNWYSAFKFEALRKIYASSGADSLITAQKKKSLSAYQQRPSRAMRQMAFI